MFDICRHTSLNILLSDKQKFGPTYGNIVLAIDGKEYWRRQVFPQYKAGRKAGREESDTDWKTIGEIGATLREEFLENFPWKIIHVPEAEGDDIIAIMCKWTQTNELNQHGLFEAEPQNVLIKSNDGDFGQLHKYSNVRQWNPITKKYVEKSGKHALLEKCLHGDKGDGIPAIRSGDNQFINGIRQPPITAAIKEKAIAQFDAGQPVIFDDPEWNKNYARNRKLIDFDFIPKSVEESVIEAYLNSKPVLNKGKIFNYCVKNRLNQITGRIHEF